MASAKKTLVVLGATGNQGGSVVRTFLSDPSLAAEWHVRGVTRNASSDAVTKLSGLGAEMVSATLDSVAELKSAFEGATAIFAVTDFWSAVHSQEVVKRVQEEGVGLAIAAQDLEETWGRNLAAAAADIPGLERLVLSTLPPVSELSHGKLKHVHHFDGKANMVKHIQKTHPDLWLRTSQILVGFYTSNILPGSYFPPTYNPSTNQAEFDGPASVDALVPFIDVASSTGPFVKALVLTEPAGTVLAAYDEMKSMGDCIEVIKKATGRELIHVQKTIEEIAAASPLGLEVPESWLWLAEYGLLGEKVAEWWKLVKSPADLTEKLELRSVEGWIKEQDWSKAFEAV